MNTLGFLRSLVLFLLACVAAHANARYSIVFVHVGKAVPAYAKIAIAQAREFNPRASIVLLASQEAIDTLGCDHGLNCVALESLNKSEHHEKFLALTSLDAKSREGFWLYASERFLYLADWMDQFDMTHVFHMEYDNMLYVDLENLLPIFESRYPEIGATFDNDDRCIPGFVYINNKDAMNRLAQCFSEHARESLNDMQLLSRFRTANGQGSNYNLPVITTEYVEEHPLLSPFGHTVANSEGYVKNLREFQSIFDAAALGQFLGGIDPRNGESAPGFINESCVFNPALLRIEWMKDELGRKIPYVVYPHASYRINNLHIHSKRLEQFVSREAS